MTGMDGHDELLGVPQGIDIAVVSSDRESDIVASIVVEEGLLELVISILFISFLAVGFVLIRGIGTIEAKFFKDRRGTGQSGSHLRTVLPLGRTARVDVDQYDIKN